MSSDQAEIYTDNANNLEKNKEEVLIAAIDSSGLVASVAVADNESIVAEYSIQYKKTHSQTILPMLEQIQNMTELDLSRLSAIAVAAGPGSFTGLRIGSATAKGLGLALNLPIIEIPTLHGLAYNLYGVNGNICPIMDARRGQVYTSIYRFNPRELNCNHETRGTVDFIMEQLHPQCAVPIEEIADRLNEMGQEVIFLGDGVPVFARRLSEMMKVPYTFAPSHRNRQSAASLAALGCRYYSEGRMVPAADHVPIYLRASQAERERLEKEAVHA